MLSQEALPCNEYPSMPVLGVVSRGWPLKLHKNGFTVLRTNMKEENDKKDKNSDTAA